MKGKLEPYRHNPGNFYYPYDDSSEGSVTKSDDFDPTPIANSKGTYSHCLPSKNMEVVIEEWSAEYYGLLPKDKLQ